MSTFSFSCFLSWESYACLQLMQRSTICIYGERELPHVDPFQFRAKNNKLGTNQKTKNMNILCGKTEARKNLLEAREGVLWMHMTLSQLTAATCLEHKYGVKFEEKRSFYISRHDDDES